MKTAMRLIISIAIPLAVGAVSGFFTEGSVNSWFATIHKPSFNPPDWLFGPVWTILYVMMGVAFFFIWRSEEEDELKGGASIFYFIQLFLNFAWSFIFFYYRQPGWALADIVLLWIMILLTILWFKKISSAASWLMVPYIFWVSFAMVLNYSIWKLN